MCLSAVKLDHRGELFWDTPSVLQCLGICILSLAHDLNKGVPTLFAYCEKLIWKCFFKFSQGTCPWMAFAWIFFSRDFSDFFFEGGLWGKSLIGKIQYFGAQIFPVVWPVLATHRTPTLNGYICMLINEDVFRFAAELVILCETQITAAVKAASFNVSQNLWLVVRTFSMTYNLLSNCYRQRRKATSRSR